MLKSINFIKLFIIYNIVNQYFISIILSNT
jgi:hypothetical protein